MFRHHGNRGIGNQQSIVRTFFSGLRRSSGALVFGVVMLGLCLATTAYSAPKLIVKDSLGTTDVFTVDQTGSVFANGPLLLGTQSPDTNENLSVRSSISATTGLFNKAFYAHVTASPSGSASGAWYTAGQYYVDGNIGFNLGSLISQRSTMYISPLTGVTIGDASAVTARLANAGAGTISNAYLMRFEGIVNVGTGNITNAYGLYMPAITAGSSGNYAIYSAGGASVFAGPMTIGATSSPSLTGSGKLDVAGNGIRIRNPRTPAGSSDTCNQGEMAWDSSYVYVCVATNTWKRAALSSW